MEAGLVRHIPTACRLGLGDARLPAFVAEQPVKALGLQSQEVGHFQGFADLRKRETA